MRGASAGRMTTEVGVVSWTTWTMSPPRRKGADGDAARAERVWSTTSDSRVVIWIDGFGVTTSMRCWRVAGVGAGREWAEALR
jgi:hypothetical protein